MPRDECFEFIFICWRERERDLVLSCLVYSNLNIKNTFDIIEDVLACLPAQLYSSPQFLSEGGIIQLLFKRPVGNYVLQREIVFGAESLLCPYSMTKEEMG